MPSDIGRALTMDNGKAWLRMRVTLNADATAAYSPTLTEWMVSYSCRSGA